MNKRYMDFVPVNSAHKVVREDVGVAKKSKSPESTTVPNKVASGPQLGVIEDLQPRFVKTKVEKRPLSRPVPKTSLKAKRPLSRPAPMANPKEKVSKKTEEEQIFENALKQANLFVDNDSKKKEERPKKRTEMKTPFVNTEKVTKRPLSKNVYQRKVVVPKEEPEKPIKIITTEKKDSKIGIIVAVIITIILGATAGTVAFLLLPK